MSTDVIDRLIYLNEGPNDGAPFSETIPGMNIYPGAKLALESFSIDFSSSNIVLTNNIKFAWSPLQESNSEFYNQARNVTIPAGTYTSISLASAIESALNTSILQTNAEYSDPIRENLIGAQFNVKVIDGKLSIGYRPLDLFEDVDYYLPQIGSQVIPSISTYFTSELEGVLPQQYSYYLGPYSYSSDENNIVAASAPTFTNFSFPFYTVTDSWVVGDVEPTPGPDELRILNRNLPFDTCTLDGGDSFKYAFSILSLVTRGVTTATSYTLNSFASITYNEVTTAYDVVFDAPMTCPASLAPYQNGDKITAVIKGPYGFTYTSTSGPVDLYFFAPTVNTTADSGFLLDSIGPGTNVPSFEIKHMNEFSGEYSFPDCASAFEFSDNNNLITLRRYGIGNIPGAFDNIPGTFDITELVFTTDDDWLVADFPFEAGDTLQFSTAGSKVIAALGVNQVGSKVAVTITVASGAAGADDLQNVFITTADILVSDFIYGEGDPIDFTGLGVRNIIRIRNGGVGGYKIVLSVNGGITAPGSDTIEVAGSDTLHYHIHYGETNLTYDNAIAGQYNESIRFRRFGDSLVINSYQDDNFSVAGGMVDVVIPVIAGNGLNFRVYPEFNEYTDTYDSGTYFLSVQRCVMSLFTPIIPRSEIEFYSGGDALFSFLLGSIFSYSPSPGGLITVDPYTHKALGFNQVFFSNYNFSGWFIMNGENDIQTIDGDVINIICGNVSMSGVINGSNYTLLASLPRLDRNQNKFTYVAGPPRYVRLNNRDYSDFTNQLTFDLRTGINNVPIKFDRVEMTLSLINTPQ